MTSCACGRELHGWSLESFWREELAYPRCTGEGCGHQVEPARLLEGPRASLPSLHAEAQGQPVAGTDSTRLDRAMTLAMVCLGIACLAGAFLHYLAA